MRAEELFDGVSRLEACQRWAERMGLTVRHGVSAPECSYPTPVVFAVTGPGGVNASIGDLDDLGAWLSGFEAARGAQP